MEESAHALLLRLFRDMPDPSMIGKHSMTSWLSPSVWCSGAWNTGPRSKTSARLTKSAYVHENHAVFGQLEVADKTNEITAIPSLLKMLPLRDATVTIDAMGCQRDIAQKIVDRKGHAVLAIKANQSSLQEDVQVFKAGYDRIDLLTPLGSKATGDTQSTGQISCDCPASSWHRARRLDSADVSRRRPEDIHREMDKGRVMGHARRFICIGGPLQQRCEPA